MSLAIISAILLVLAFPNFNLNFLAFIGFVPLFITIQNKSPQKTFLISYVCGFLFYLGVLYWLYHVTMVGLIVLCLYLALYFGVFGLFFNAIVNYFVILRARPRRGRVEKFSTRFARSNSIILLLLVPLIWIALEYLQANLFSGFGWALLGYSQYKILPLIQIADFSGVYGVSFLVMMVNVAVYKAFKKSFKEIVITGIVFVIAIGYGMTRLNEGGEGNSIRISVIQGNIPQDIKWNPAATEAILNKYTVLTKTAALDKSDLIIWPETSFPGFLVSDKKMTKQILELVREIKTPLLLGANTETPSPNPLPSGERVRVRGEQYFNSAVLISEKAKIIDKYDKIHLVPFGEYVPFSDRFPVLHNLILGELGEFTPGRDFKVFPLVEARPPPLAGRGLAGRDRASTTQFSVLICFEDIFPGLSRKFVQNGAQFLVVITNDAWYGNSGMPYQHAACSVFRAIENRVPVVRCANTGYSCFIDSRGRIYDSVKEDVTHLFITGHKTSNVTMR